jgi:hypothetical protein
MLLAIIFTLPVNFEHYLEVFQYYAIVDVDNRNDISSEQFLLYSEYLHELKRE